MRILIRNARLIHGTGTAAQDGAALLIEGDTIVGPSGLRDEIKQASDTYRRARELGIRMCPGGDFGFAWNPHGEYANDIQNMGVPRRSENPRFGAPPGAW